MRDSPSLNTSGTSVVPGFRAQLTERPATITTGNASEAPLRRVRRSAIADSPTAYSDHGRWPLVEAKLVAPRGREGMVERPRLLRALDAGADAALTLVAAPAGSGKSTAVRGWCASGDMTQAWVTLDAGDNDPVRLWAYVATAIGRALSDRVGAEIVMAPPLSGSIDALLNRIASSASELVLVLDAVQTVIDGERLACASRTS